MEPTAAGDEENVSYQQETDGSSPTTTGTKDFRLRSYQDEMLDASLRGNSIIVMETGSGKTFVAISRIRAELERSGSERLIW